MGSLAETWMVKFEAAFTELMNMLAAQTVNKAVKNTRVSFLYDFMAEITTPALLLFKDRLCYAYMFLVNNYFYF